MIVIAFKWPTGSNSTGDIYIDKTGNIYVEAGGLSISNDNGASFVNKTTADGFASNRISGISGDSDGHIYLGSWGDGISISEDNGVSFSVVDDTDGLPGGYIMYLLGTNNGDMYFGTSSEGIFRNKLDLWCMEVSTILTLSSVQLLGGKIRKDLEIKRNIYKINVWNHL